MGKSYSDIGLGDNLMGTSSLPFTRRAGGFIDNLSFDGRYDAQTSRINASKVNLGEFVKFVDGSTALGTFTLSTALNLSSTITYKTPKKNKKTFGKPMVVVYQGNSTNSANQIYPVSGANVTLGRYDIMGGVGNAVTYDGTSDRWDAQIVDTNGTSSQVITLDVNWIFADYATDTVT